MSDTPLPLLTDDQIVGARPARNTLAFDRPWHSLVEPELAADGVIKDVATVFLTNRECAFRCLMCDLWKNTTEQKTPSGAIPQQIRYVLERLPPAQQIKLYNSGNFFDPNSVPREDLSEIAELVSEFESVIVENHPRMTGPRCAEFQQRCGIQLEVAMGLETSHEPTLARLNKQMTTRDFANACETLLQDQIQIRCFILLRPPFTSESEGVERAIESVRFAFECGVSCCAVIPTRSGNGILDQLESSGYFSSPRLTSLERVIDVATSWQRGRVFADLWDLGRFTSCESCAVDRIERLNQINLTQQGQQPINCSHCQQEPDGV